MTTRKFSTGRTLNKAILLGHGDDVVIGVDATLVAIKSLAMSAQGDNDLIIKGELEGAHGAIQAGENVTVDIRSTGTINGTSPNAPVIDLQGTSDVLKNVGTIGDNKTPAIGVQVQGANTTLINSGQITAVHEAIAFRRGSAGAGIETIINSGNIVGDFGNNNAFTIFVPDTDTEALHVTNTGYMKGTVQLGAGNDVFDSLQGTQIGGVYGYSGDDQLLGGLGNDYFDGGAGNDLIEGGGGTNRMVGGKGSDTFLFAAGIDTGKTVVDTIADFNSGAPDTIDLKGFGSHIAFSATYEPHAGYTILNAHSGHDIVRIILDGDFVTSGFHTAADKPGTGVSLTYTAPSQSASFAVSSHA